MRSTRARTAMRETAEAMLADARRTRPQRLAQPSHEGKPSPSAHVFGPLRESFADSLEAYWRRQITRWSS